MKISVGAKLLLDLGNDKHHRVTGKLIGWKSSESILVSIPLFIGIRNYMESGCCVTCRYMYEGIVYGFRSYVQGYVAHPESIVFLSFPDSWESVELRRQERLPCFFPASFEVGGYEAMGILNDISEMGCRIICGPSRENVLEHIILGAETVIRFCPFGEQPWYEISALVVNAETDEKKITGIGFKFPRTTEDFRKKIKSYILKIQECSL